MKTYNFILAVMILLTSSVSAQENSPEVDEGIASIKQKKFDFNAEARLFKNEPEFLIRYKNISLDWIHDDENFYKLKVDKEIFSLMGTGLEWNVALNGVDENFAILPSVGVNFYMRIRPRLDVYLQISGLPFGGHGHISDFESGIKYFLRRDFSISAGWRRIDFKRRRSDFDLSGTFVGVRYYF